MELKKTTREIFLKQSKTKFVATQRKFCTKLLLSLSMNDHVQMQSFGGTVYALNTVSNVNKSYAFITINQLKHRMQVSINGH